MSISTKAIAFALSASVLFACNEPTDPKEVSIQFIEHLNAHQFDQAASLATEGTRQSVADLKNEVSAATPAVEDKTAVDAMFATGTLQPYISGNKAIVKNNLLSLNLEKVDDDWQVVASKDVVEDIVHRTKRIAGVKTSWEALAKEYDNRSGLLREYINYMKSSGRDMPEVQALDEGLKVVPVLDAQPTKEKILAYVRAQQAIDVLADKALQPTLTASADLTMNYIISMQDQAAKIGEAKAAYNKAAAEANSDVYTIVP
jgi:hypothetical protein